MVDLSGMPPAFMGNMTFHGVTDASAKRDDAIKQSDTGNSLSGNSTSDQSRGLYDIRSRTSNDPEAANTNKPIRKPDDNAHPGPPPSFNISILEVERDLAQVLARINAEKSLPGDVEAVSAKSGKDAPDTSADTAPQTARDTATTEARVQPTFAPERADPPASSGTGQTPDQAVKLMEQTEARTATAQPETAQPDEGPARPELVEDA